MRLFAPPCTSLRLFAPLCTSSRLFAPIQQTLPILPRISMTTAWARPARPGAVNKRRPSARCQTLTGSRTERRRHQCCQRPPIPAGRVRARLGGRRNCSSNEAHRP